MEEFSNSLTPDPSAPAPGNWEGPRGARVPGAGKQRAEQRAVLTCRRISSRCLPGLQYPWCGLAGSWRSPSRVRGSPAGERAALRSESEARRRLAFSLDLASEKEKMSWCRDTRRGGAEEAGGERT